MWLSRIIKEGTNLIENPVARPRSAQRQDETLRHLPALAGSYRYKTARNDEKSKKPTSPFPSSLPIIPFHLLIYYPIALSDYFTHHPQKKNSFLLSI
jgi:hypothetical protein